MLGHEAEVHAGLLIDLVAAGPFQIQQACEQIRSGIHRHHAAHDSPDFRIKEWCHELLYQPRTGNVIRIENQDDFGGHEFHGIFQCRCFAALAPNRDGTAECVRESPSQTRR